MLSAVTERAGVPAAEVEDVYFGNANGAGEDGPPAAGREPYLLALILDSPYFVWR